MNSLNKACLTLFLGFAMLFYTSYGLTEENTRNREIPLPLSHFREIFQRVGEALKANNVNEALQYIAFETRPEYAHVFAKSPEKYGNKLLSSHLSCLSKDYVIGNQVECEIVRRSKNGIDYSYPIIFVKGRDGVWRIGRL